MCFTCLLVCFKHIRIDPNCTTQWETWHRSARMIQTRNPKPTTNTRTKTETWTGARSSSSNKTPPLWQKYKQQGSCVISRCGKTCWRGSTETPKLFVSCAHTLKWCKHKVKSKTKNVPTMSAQTQEDSHHQQTWSGTQRCRVPELLITLRPFCSHLLTSSRDCSSVAPIHAVPPSYFNIQSVCQTPLSPRQQILPSVLLHLSTWDVLQKQLLSSPSPPSSVCRADPKWSISQ